MPHSIRNNLRTYRAEKSRRRQTAMRTAANTLKRHGVQKPKYIKPTKSAVKTLKMQNGGKSKKHKKHKKSRTTKSRKKSKANRKPRYFHFMSL